MITVNLRIALMQVFYCLIKMFLKLKGIFHSVKSNRSTTGVSTLQMMQTLQCFPSQKDIFAPWTCTSRSLWGPWRSWSKSKIKAHCKWNSLHYWFSFCIHAPTLTFHFNWNSLSLISTSNVSSMFPVRWFLNMHISNIMYDCILINNMSLSMSLRIIGMVLSPGQFMLLLWMTSSQLSEQQLFASWKLMILCCF